MRFDDEGTTLPSGYKQEYGTAGASAWLMSNALFIALFGEEAKKKVPLEVVEKALNRLPDREAKAIRMCIIEELTLKEVAPHIPRAYGTPGTVGRARVGQLVNKGLRQMRRYISLMMEQEKGANSNQAKA